MCMEISLCYAQNCTRELFYVHAASNTTICLITFDGLRHSLKEECLDLNNALQFTIQLLLERNVLSYFHYKLLRLLLSKYQGERTKAEDSMNMVKVLLKSAKYVSLCDSFLVQREYLKIVNFMVKNQVIQMEKETVDPFLIWFKENSWTFLDKYFLKMSGEAVPSGGSRFYPPPCLQIVIP